MVSPGVLPFPDAIASSFSNPLMYNNMLFCERVGGGRRAQRMGADLEAEFR
jgi:hypothetical protein